MAAGRSFCPACGTTLAWYDLIPLLSWLFLRGRCRRCHAPISARYPAVELTNGVLWALIYWQLGWQWHTLFVLLLASALLVAALIDWDTHLVPNGLVVFLAPLGMLEAFLQPQLLSPWARIGGLLCISVPMLLLSGWKKGFGGGDIKLVAVCGFFLGWQAILLGTLLACVTGCAHGAWLAVTGKTGRKTQLPFVPHLAFGFVLAALWAQPLLQAYAQLWGLA